MPVTLSTVSDGTAMSAATMVTTTGAIEAYLNEQIAASDLQSATPWLRSLQVFRPAYYSGPDSGKTARFEGTSAEVHYFYRSDTDTARSVHHSQTNVGGWVTVVGMGRTFACAENISSGAAPTKRAHTSVCFYAYEYGGDGCTDDTTNPCADLAMVFDGTVYTETTRHLLTASYYDDPSRLMCRKQYAAMYPFAVGLGVHSVGLAIQVKTQTKGDGLTAGNDNWRHLFITSRSMQVEYDYR